MHSNGLPCVHSDGKGKGKGASREGKTGGRGAGSGVNGGRGDGRNKDFETFGDAAATFSRAVRSAVCCCLLCLLYGVPIFNPANRWVASQDGKGSRGQSTAAL